MVVQLNARNREGSHDSPYHDIYSLLAIGLTFSMIKNRQKTGRVFIIAGKGLLKSAPTLLAMMGLVGLTLGVLTPKIISNLLGEGAGVLGTLIAAGVGAITLMPSLIAFPLAGSLLRSGAAVMTISAFVTSLVMVGVATAPMEAKNLGLRFTLLRNGLGFISALIIAVVMGVLL